MRKYLIPAVLAAALLLVFGRGQAEVKTPLAELPADYTLEQAKQDGCITRENGQITQGRKRFDKFYRQVTEGKPDAVRLANYYTLGDPSSYAPEYYATIKDAPPLLFIQDLSFDGEKFTLQYREDGELKSRQYLYLMKYEEPAESPRASYQASVRYVLVNDGTLTWPQLWHAQYSSWLEDRIDHAVIHTDYIYE